MITIHIAILVLGILTALILGGNLTLLLIDWQINRGVLPHGLKVKREKLIKLLEEKGGETGRQ